MTVELVSVPLADRAEAMAAEGTAVVGLCGPQGSGKTTIAAATVDLLRSRGLKAVALSLDDFYLSRDARGWLADKVHPLLATRGPPGTHDIALACAVLDGLNDTGPTPLPAFDKSLDERVPKDRWPAFDGPADVVIFEGWCVGARPQPSDALAEPVNELESLEDPDVVWRAYVNRELAAGYQALWSRLSALVLLQPPGFEVVQAWRAEQEAELRARTGRGMSDSDIARFVAHYERLTRWIQSEMPARADWTIRLDADRRPA